MIFLRRLKESVRKSRSSYAPLKTGFCYLYYRFLNHGFLSSFLFIHRTGRGNKTKVVFFTFLHKFHVVFVIFSPNFCYFLLTRWEFCELSCAPRDTVVWKNKHKSLGGLQKLMCLGIKKNGMGCSYYCPAPLYIKLDS